MALPAVWIYSNPYQDGPVRMVRATATAQIAQREGPNEQVLVNGEAAVWGAGEAMIPPGFGLALAQALNAARRAADEQGHDQVVTARPEGERLVWRVYPVDEVPVSPNPKPEPPAPHSDSPPWAGPRVSTPSYPVNPADL
ncbi:hypothetical protein J7E97_16165 [Streptomyces sp. ISL-66]|uniref:hypothetical protein n=1 Tax=Streptomyces sp. ISL-66 TaxID=2819186 RepID=UPI001BE7A31C|nr:hypothetical protein [Streptomyces sp. ISL-66]MBT2469369.1 hypothetical protein [Streptomyces sp. ISL-66]